MQCAVLYLTVPSSYAVITVCLEECVIHSLFVSFHCPLSPFPSLPLSSYLLLLFPLLSLSISLFLSIALALSNITPTTLAPTHTPSLPFQSVTLNQPLWLSLAVWIDEHVLDHV